MVAGSSPWAGLLCLPTLNMHGYAVIKRDAIDAMTDLVVGFVNTGP
jgi:hypothetical protein